jgi:hypothetical protein
VHVGSDSHPRVQKGGPVDEAQSRGAITGLTRPFPEPDSNMSTTRTCQEHHVLPRGSPGSLGSAQGGQDTAQPIFGANGASCVSFPLQLPSEGLTTRYRAGRGTLSDLDSLKGLPKLAKMQRHPTPDPYTESVSPIMTHFQTSRHQDRVGRGVEDGGDSDQVLQILSLPLARPGA